MMAKGNIWRAGWSAGIVRGQEFFHRSPERLKASVGLRYFRLSPAETRVFLGLAQKKGRGKVDEEFLGLCTLDNQYS